MSALRLALIAPVMFCVLANSVTAGAQSPEALPTRDSIKAAPATVTDTAHRKAQHARIREERTALAASRQRDEAACYQRFAVEDCLREVRVKVRGVENLLRSQEIELNDVERREKAAERLRVIEEKQSAVPAL